MGLDPHYAFGKNQVYPAGNFGYHLKPFQAAIDAGVSSIMPYYGVPIAVTHEGVTYDQTGMAFSKQIVTDLLRGKLGFRGYVNSDTGIINDRAWGLEEKTVPERVAAAINGGTETLSGFHDVQTIIDLVTAGLVTEERVDRGRPAPAGAPVPARPVRGPVRRRGRRDRGRRQPEHRAVGLDLQRKSIVLLQNQDAGDGAKVLPLASSARVYTMGIDGDVTKADVASAPRLHGAADAATCPRVGRQRRRPSVGRRLTTRA